MAAEGSSTSASDTPAASNKAASNVARVPASPQQVSLPPPSSPSSVLRRKMASSAPKRDAVPPRRPGAAASTSSTTTRSPSSASKPLASSTSRLGGSERPSSLNKPPTRAPAGTAARTIGAATQPAAGRATPAEHRRSTIAPVATAAKRPSTTSRPSAEHTTSTRAATRASTSASLPASTPAKPAASRPSINTRTAHHVVPKAPVSTITPKTPVAHAKRPSVTSVTVATSPTKASPAAAAAAALTHSPIDVPPRSYGQLKDKAASDAEVEVKKTVPFGPPKASLPKVGEEGRRPGTAPSGPAEVDEESRRRSLVVMQDFFKETSRREKLQEQCDDLHREIDRLQGTNTKLRKQLVDAQAAITETDKAAAGAGTEATGWDEKKHNTIVTGMEKKFALETKLLEEQKQKLGEEKRVAQEKEAVEAAKAAELQQVLDDLNVELERQGREWDAEKLQLVEQGAQIDALTKEVTILREERDTLSADLASANTTLESLQTKLSDLENDHATEVQDMNGKIDSLTETVTTLRSEASDAEKRHFEISEEAKRSLESNSSNSSKLVEELQAKMTSMQQQHTETMREKDGAIASHVQTEKELHDNIEKLQQQADQTTANLDSERNAHAENLKAKIAEILESSKTELSAKEADLSSHLKSIEGLQSQIATFQQGETDGATVSQELTRQIEDLKTIHEEAIRLKTEQNEELVQQLEAVNDQLSSDAAEIEHLKEQADVLRRTVESLEQTSEQDKMQHEKALTNSQTEVAEAKKKAVAYKSDLDAAQDRHRQDLRVLGEDHDAEIDSLRADLEGDAKKRLDKLQAEYDALVAEKNTALKGHENSLADRLKQLGDAQKEIATLKESSGSTSQGLDEANARHLQLVEEKNALADAHFTAQKQVADLEARVEALTVEGGLVADLQARLDASTEDRQAATDALAASKKAFTDLQAKVKAMTKENALIGELQARLDAATDDAKATNEALEASKKSLTDRQARLDTLTQEREAANAERINTEETLAQTQRQLEGLIQEKQASTQERAALEKERSELHETITDLTNRYDILVEERTEMELTHARAVDGLKEESESATKQILDKLQSKYDTLVEEKGDADHAHAKELADIHTRCEALVKQLAEVEEKLEENRTTQAAMERAHAEALDKALDSQRQEIEQKYAVFLEEAQADIVKLEQEQSAALAEKESALEHLEDLEAKLRAQIDDLKRELEEKEQIDSEGLVEVSKKYEVLLAEQAAADKEDRDVAIADLQKQLAAAKQELERKEQSDSAGLAEVAEKYESLLAEQAAADKRDHEAELALVRDSADTDLNETKERYEILIIEKDFLKDELERARDDAITEIDELRRELEAKETTRVADMSEVSKKYQDLLAEHTAAAETHEAALSELKRLLGSEREQAMLGLRSQNDALQEQFQKMDEEHQQTLDQMRKELENNHSTDTDALRHQLDTMRKLHTDTTNQMVKAHEDSISELITSMQKATADAVEQLREKCDSLEARISAEKASHAADLDGLQRESAEQQVLCTNLQTRFDKTVAELEASSEDVKRLQETIEAIETERDRAYKAVEEAEDRIETFKGEVVRKHLARVEPLQKENTALLNKIDRLQDMLAAGDRIARAAASIGEKREINTLVEESEEGEQSSASAEDNAPNPPSVALKAHGPLLNGSAKDVVGTLAAMQETLSQLNALNNDAMAESERTAQRLTERD